VANTSYINDTSIIFDLASTYKFGKRGRHASPSPNKQIPNFKDRKNHSLFADKNKILTFKKEFFLFKIKQKFNTKQNEK
jgi:hypothetical protein